MSKATKGKKKAVIEPPEELTNASFSPPPESSPHDDRQARPRRVQPKTAEELRRVMDIVQSRISVIIDSLEGDENEVSIKRNVVTAVKHLKQISNLLE